jgi:hypothetical protein
MAATIKKVVRAITTKVVNIDFVGKNWSQEIHEITGDGTDTTYVLTTDLKTIEFLSCTAVDGTAPFTGIVTSDMVITDTAGVKTLTIKSWVSAAGTALAIASTKKVRVMLFGTI